MAPEVGLGINWKRFGGELKKHRERRKLTQDALAKIGVGWNTMRPPRNRQASAVSADP